MKRGIDAALLGREFLHFVSSPNYMLNCGLGTFLMTLCAIAVLWKGGEMFVKLDVMFAETAGSVPLLLCVVLCGFVYMALLFAGFMLLPGWILGFGGYMSCFVGVNLFISVLAYLWLRKKGVAIFVTL